MCGSCFIYRRFIIFGSRVFYLNRDPGKSKWAARGEEGIFLGIAEDAKAYRVWSPKKGKVLISRDVKFFETNSDVISVIQQENNPEEQIRRYADIDHAEPSLQERKSPVADRDDEEDFLGFERSVVTYVPGASDTAGITEEVAMTFLSEVPMKEAMTGPDASDWLHAMTAEMESIIKNNTWTLVDRPKGRKVIGSRMVLRNKLKPDGTLERRKARLVAQGFSQQPGRDYSETFAPVARFGSIRLMASLAARYNMKIRQFDVKTAYLNGDLEEEVFMELPKASEDILQRIVDSTGDYAIKEKAKTMLHELHKGDKVCLLNKSLYGLKQAGRSWFFKLSETLKKYGATPTDSDPCLFRIGSGEDIMLITIYVDDILIASRNQKSVSAFWAEAVQRV